MESKLVTDGLRNMKLDISHRRMRSQTMLSTSEWPQTISNDHRLDQSVKSVAQASCLAPWPDD